MQPKEYKYFIKFAINSAKQPIKKVYIGLDFYGSLTYSKKKYNNTNIYFKNTESTLYKYKLLLSIDALNTSFHNLKRYFFKSNDTYNRNNIKRANKDFKDTKNSEKFDISFMKRHKYADFKYDKTFIHYLKELKNSFPSIEFKIFTTPISKDLLNYVVQTKRYGYYENWLSDIVKVFGNVNNLMYLNEITIQNKYFMDSNHAYPIYYKKVAKLLNNQNIINENISINITKDNIKQKLKLLRELNNY
jgi:hypothetical protein